jgi:transposase
MDDEGEKLRVTGVHRNGRRAFDAVSKSRLIESCLQPGGSVAQLALDHGVNANLLWNWIRKQRLAQKARLPQPPSTSAFVPVDIEAAADGGVPSMSVLLRWTSGPVIPERDRRNLKRQAHFLLQPG